VIVPPLLRWTGLAILALHLPLALLAAQQVERYTIAGGDVAIYNLTGRIGDGRGKIAIETGSGGIKLFKGQ
jgi:hypothetical protein